MLLIVAGHDDALMNYPAASGEVPDKELSPFCAAGREERTRQRFNHTRVFLQWVSNVTSSIVHRLDNWRGNLYQNSPIFRSQLD